MGVGKSTIGRLLSAQLGRPVSDSDTVIANERGSTVRELDERLGVEEMHRLEAEHLLGALADPQPSIICAAASVVDAERCRVALESPDVLPVWLRGDPDLLAARFATGPHRPHLADDLGQLLREQYRTRAPRFAATAHLIVDVNGRAPTEIADEIAARL